MSLNFKRKRRSVEEGRRHGQEKFQGREQRIRRSVNEGEKCRREKMTGTGEVPGKKCPIEE